MDEAIAAYVRRNHNLLVGESSRAIKKEIGSATSRPTAKVDHGNKRAGSDEWGAERSNYVWKGKSRRALQSRLEQ